MREEYEEARKLLGIPSKDFSPISPHVHLEITKKIAIEFTTLAEDAPHAWWWWEHFRQPVQLWHPDCALKFLSERLPVEPNYFFMAESNIPEKRDSNFWVYRARKYAILSILKESIYHEYYIIEPKMKWIVCENHHNEVIGSGELPETFHNN